MNYKILLILLIILVSINISIYAEEQDSDISKASQLQTPFIKNEGQIISNDVQFYTKLFNGSVFITNKGELVYSINYPRDYLGENDIFLPDGRPAQYLSEIIRETMVNNPETSAINVQGLQRAQTYVNYITDQPETRRDNVPTYNMISLGEAWPGISVNLKSNSKNIEKIFIVSPNGVPESIKISVDGIERLILNDFGTMELKTPRGGIEFTRPIAYQEINGKKKAIGVLYRLINKNTYGFKVTADYDKSIPLIIDPLLASSYIGGDSPDVSTGIARDATGNIFIVGSTGGSYPTTPGVYQSSFTFAYDAIVSKFNADITALLASTFIGSQSFRSEFGYAIAVDGSNNVFITGTVGTDTRTPSSPATPGAYDTSFNASWDAFVAKLNNNLTLSGFAFTFLGGTGDDRGYGIATDRNNNVFVCGVAGNSTFPAIGGPYTTFGGGTTAPQEGFVARFNNNLSGAGFVSTFLGGTQSDNCLGITTDSNNNVIVTGGTASPDFPTVPQVAQIGSTDVFVTKFNNGLTATLYSTRFGGTGYDCGYGITVGRANNIHITGETASTNFPVSFTGSSSLNGGIDAFITKLNPSLNIINSRYLGGNGSDIGWSVAIAPFAGQIFLTGYTASTNFPTYPSNPPPLDATLGGTSDMFVTRLDNELNLIASTYLGGTGSESTTTVASRAGIIADNGANALVTSITTSSDFPLSNPITTPYNGSVYLGGGTPPSLPSDNFICRLTPDLRGGAPVTTSTLAVPDIIYPPIYASDVTVPPALQWTAPSNSIGQVTYSLYLSTDTYPLALIYTGSQTSTTASVDYETTYYWYLVASDSTGRVSWTSVYTFTTEINPLLTSGSSGGVLFGADSFTKPLGSCFIATAVYGSPTHPNVITLKKFRDNYLTTNFAGRYLVSWYYKISPPIAAHLKNSPIQASIIRFALTPIVYTIKSPLLTALLILIGGWLILKIIKESGSKKTA